MQVPAQELLAQSAGAAHILPAAQGAQMSPPQSTSVSLPSLVPSVQEVGAAQIPAAQELLAQSAGTAHILLKAQGAQMPPPQSVSVSLPSLMLFMQEAGA